MKCKKSTSDRKNEKSKIFNKNEQIFVFNLYLKLKKNPKIKKANSKIFSNFRPKL
jgi:hypothetical protein